MASPHLSGMEFPATQPSSSDQVHEEWFATRRDFQLDVMRRVLGLERADDRALTEWIAQGSAKRFTEIVDAPTAEGAALRQLIREDHDAALDRVVAQFLH